MELSGARLEQASNKNWPHWLCLRERPAVLGFKALCTSSIMLYMKQNRVILELPYQFTRNI